MDATEFFPSKWLRAEDVGDRTVKATINGLHKEEIGTDMKPVLRFLGFEKGLVLNRTNNKKLIELFGKETDAWIGKEIELYTVMVPYRGEEVPALRIRGVQPTAEADHKSASKSFSFSDVETDAWIGRDIELFRGKA